MLFLSRKGEFQQDSEDDDEEEEEEAGGGSEAYGDGDGDPCPNCGRKYRCVIIYPRYVTPMPEYGLDDYEILWRDSFIGISVLVLSA